MIAELPRRASVARKDGCCLGLLNRSHWRRISAAVPLVQLEVQRELGTGQVNGPNRSGMSGCLTALPVISHEVLFRNIRPH